MTIPRRHLLLLCGCSPAALPVALAATTAVDLLRWDVRTGGASGSMNTDTPVLPGSLVKPFSALAYAATHGDRFPSKVRCTGCWGGRAHGEVDLVRALALSCNHYFTELSLRVDPAQMRLTAAEYGIPAPPEDAEARIGLGRQWRIAPRDLVRAYLQVRHPAIVEGLRLCARAGTAKGIGPRTDCLAKTGTSPCEHPKRMPGDGLAIVLWPSLAPREVFLVREHGVPGAIAAARLKPLLPTPAAAS